MKKRNYILLILLIIETAVYSMEDRNTEPTITIVNNGYQGGNGHSNHLGENEGTDQSQEKKKSQSNNGELRKKFYLEAIQLCQDTREQNKQFFNQKNTELRGRMEIIEETNEQMYKTVVDISGRLEGDIIQKKSDSQKSFLASANKNRDLFLAGILLGFIGYGFNRHKDNPLEWDDYGKITGGSGVALFLLGAVNVMIENYTP